MGERRCAWCSRADRIGASIDDRWYCHDDEKPSCYERASWYEAFPIDRVADVIMTYVYEHPVATEAGRYSRLIDANGRYGIAEALAAAGLLRGPAGLSGEEQPQ